ncbi:hypothetical protein [uncultured Cohaesibacter sp.]|uniref:hypothetical protein n=1 Tax=uncultured Cohaesibacter sp. TaxID=1002546 RepID=UPI0029C7B687|nr:hypothetical protein [uncultured Cohaesibacter sp.]
MAGPEQIISPYHLATIHKKRGEEKQRKHLTAPLSVPSYEKYTLSRINEDKEEAHLSLRCFAITRNLHAKDARGLP